MEERQSLECSVVILCVRLPATRRELHACAGSTGSEERGAAGSREAPLRSPRRHASDCHHCPAPRPPARASAAQHCRPVTARANPPPTQPQPESRACVCSATLTSEGRHHASRSCGRRIFPQDTTFAFSLSMLIYSAALFGSVM